MATKNIVLTSLFLQHWKKKKEMRSVDFDKLDMINGGPVTRHIKLSFRGNGKIRFVLQLLQTMRSEIVYSIFLLTGKKVQFNHRHIDVIRQLS